MPEERFGSEEILLHKALPFSICFSRPGNKLLDPLWIETFTKQVHSVHSYDWDLLIEFYKRNLWHKQIKNL